MEWDNYYTIAASFTRLLYPLGSIVAFSLEEE